MTNQPADPAAKARFKHLSRLNSLSKKNITLNTSRSTAASQGQKAPICVPCRMKKKRDYG